MLETDRHKVGAVGFVMLSDHIVTGKEVVVPHSDRPLGVVTAVIFDSLAGIVLGFALDSPGWHPASRILPWSGLRDVSAERIVAQSPGMIVAAGHLYSVRRVLERSPLWPHIPVCDAAGLELGFVCGVYFDAWTGTIQGYGLNIRPGALETRCHRVARALRVEPETMIVPGVAQPAIGPLKLATGSLFEKAHLL